MPHPPYLILGVGNRDRGDDGIGPILAETLSKDEDLKKLNIEITPHFGEGTSLMEMWQDTELTVIIDAMKSGAPAGTVQRFDANKDKLGGGQFYYSSHLFSLAEAVEMARLLKRLPPNLIIYGIEGATYTFGSPLSPEVAAVFSDVSNKVKQEFLLPSPPAGEDRKP